MCEIFPEVSNCCLICSYRIGMLFIAVAAMISGSISLSVAQMTSDTNFDNAKSITNIKGPQQAESALDQLIPTAICVISVLFMLFGLVLLIATLTNNEGFVQIFVWGTFLAIIFGFLVIIAISYECMMKDVCYLSSMDWLTGSALLVFLIGYLFLWVYFISVANSYIINGD